MQSTNYDSDDSVLGEMYFCPEMEFIAHTPAVQAVQTYPSYPVCGMAAQVSELESDMSPAELKVFRRQISSAPAVLECCRDDTADLHSSAASFSDLTFPSSLTDSEQLSNRNSVHDACSEKCVEEEPQKERKRRNRKRKSKSGAKREIPEATREPPCAHNGWDRLTKKRNSISLKCRQCRAYWKTRIEFFTKCRDFYSGSCPRGDSCPHPHIYSKAAEKRQQLFNRKAEKKMQ